MSAVIAESRTEPATSCAGICGNCQHARRFDRALLERWGVPLQLRSPALVRRCAVHSGIAAPQLVQVSWTCREWRH